MDTHFSTYICYNKCLPIESSRVDNVKTDSSYFNSLARSSFKTKNKESRFTIYAYAAKNRRTTEEISQTPNGITSAQLGFYSSPLGCTRLHSAPLGSLLGRRRGRERRGCRGCRGSGRRLLRQLGWGRELRRRATSYTALHIGPVNVTAYRVYYNI